MSATATQRDRVLRALERSGRRGITSVDFQLPDVIDGGKPILRLAARIEELGEQGHRIVDGGRRGKCKVYVLASASEGVPPEQPSSPSTAGGLPSGAERLTDWRICLRCNTRTRTSAAVPPLDCCDDPIVVTFYAAPAGAPGCDCARCDQGYPCAYARAAA